MSGRLCAGLAGILVLCALSLVNAQYQHRELFIQLEAAKSQARQLDVDWAQLQLDQSTYATHARVEQIARRDLHMIPVTPDRTLYLKMGAP